MIDDVINIGFLPFFFDGSGYIIWLHINNSSARSNPANVKYIVTYHCLGKSSSKATSDILDIYLCYGPIYLC